MTTKKLPLTEDIIINIITNIFTTDNFSNLSHFCFKKEDLIKYDAVKKWKSEGLGDILRKYIKSSECKSLSVSKENKLKESDIITILRFALKKVGYDLLLLFTTNGRKAKFYTIDKEYLLEKNT